MGDRRGSGEKKETLDVWARGLAGFWNTKSQQTPRTGKMLIDKPDRALCCNLQGAFPSAPIHENLIILSKLWNLKRNKLFIWPVQTSTEQGMAKNKTQQIPMC